jgi:hypothetical protein
LVAFWRFFNVPDDEVKDLTSVETILDGEVVYGDGDSSALSPAAHSAMPGSAVTVIPQALQYPPQ